MEEMVLEAIKKAGEPVRPGDVAKTVGLAKDEVSKIIRNLKKKGRSLLPKGAFMRQLSNNLSFAPRT